MAGNPYSLQPVIDYIQHPNSEDSQMGRKMLTQNPSVIVPVIVALHRRIELYKEVNLFNLSTLARVLPSSGCHFMNSDVLVITNKWLEVWIQIPLTQAKRIHSIFSDSSTFLRFYYSCGWKQV